MTPLLSISRIRLMWLPGIFAAVLSTSSFAVTRVVTNTNDSGAGSLRATVIASGAGDVITFAMPSGTISLTSPIPVTTALTVNGPGADLLTISGSNVTRIFNVTSTVTISGLTLQSGNADGIALRGGAIHNTGSLTLDSMVLKLNQAVDGGGAIYNESSSAATGQLTIRNSELWGNVADDFAGVGGGAILSTSVSGNAASVTIINSTVSGNGAVASIAGMSGGGIYFANGALRIFNSTVAGNNAGIAGGDIHQGRVANTSLTIRNSIISGGIVNAIGAPVADFDIFQPATSTINSLGYNIVGHRSAGTGYAPSDAPDNTDPLLGSISANGGATRTMLPLPTSTAVSFVPVASCVDETGAALTRDQRGFGRRTVYATACDAGAAESLRLVAVLSRKYHGAAPAVPREIPINAATALSGLVDVEPRTIGAGHLLAFQFNGPVSAISTAGVSPVGSATATRSGNEVLVSLTNVPDNRRVTVSLTGVGGLALPVTASLGYLVGDVTGKRSVNAADISAVKANRNQTVDNENFKFDVDAVGTISDADVSAVKARSGKVLPP